MSNKKKTLTAVTAVVMAVALLLGGTFAWQSINQTALNEASDVINPGGRLHDDFNGKNKDVYVENFAEDPIFARVRLDEYFEIVMNKGSAAETTEIVTTGATKGETNTYVTHLFGDTNATDEYWNWATGGSTIYVPTFNKNKDSLAADINGTYNGLDGIVTDEATDDRYSNYETYEDQQVVPGTEIYDADTNNIEDENVKEVEATHTAKPTLDATLISMEQWIAEGMNPGEYWVYDTDGWVYWAQAIQPDTATGLLLDGIELTQVMDDSWYYAINVVAQFITADDLGKSDNTGFYDTDNGTVPTNNALALLEKIGVQVDDEAGTGEPTEPDAPVYDDATLAIINEIATADVVGSVASGGIGADIYNNAESLSKVTIDGEQYFVVVRDESTPGAERALLLKYGEYAFPVFEHIDEGYKGYDIAIYTKYGNSTKWEDSNVHALLNSTEPVTIKTATYYSDTTAYEVKVTPFLTENTTVAQIAIPTEISTRVYDDEGNYTYETTTCQVFVMSEADVNGTIGGVATGNTEDYTYVLNGQGVDLFDYALGGEYTGGSLASYCYGWLRSVDSVEKVGYMTFDGSVVGNYPQGGYQEWVYDFANYYNHGFVYPMFWADISEADIYAD